MAPSAIDISTLDSTSQLFADLDIAAENMGSVKSDDFMDVPDTPDRFTVQSGNVEKEFRLPVSSTMESDDPLPISGRGFLRRQRSNCRLSTHDGNTKNLYAQHRRDLRISDLRKYNKSFPNSVADNLEKETLVSHEYFSDGLNKPEISLPGLSRISNNHSLKTKRSKDWMSVTHGAEISTETQPKKPLTLSKRDTSSSTQPNLGGEIDGDFVPQMLPLTPGPKKLPTLASVFKNKGGDREKVIDLSSTAQKEPVRKKISSDSSALVGNRYARRKILAGSGSSGSGNNLCVGVSSTTQTCQDGTHIQNMASPHRFGMESETKSKLQEPNGMYIGACTSMTPTDLNGKEKGRDKGKGIELCKDSYSRTNETVSNCFQSITSPRPTRRRMLVRNGLISPDNIARSKNTLDGSHKEVANNKQDGPDFDCNQNDRKKGKGIVEDNGLADDFGATPKSLSIRNKLVPVEVDSSTGHANGDATGFVEELGNWRSTRNRSRKISFQSANEINNLSYSLDGCFDNINEERNHITDEVNFNPEIDLHEISTSYPSCDGTRPSSVQAAASIISDSDPEIERRLRGAQKLTRRQRKFTLPACDNPGECSSSGFDDLDVSCLQSSRKPPVANLSGRVRSSQRRVLEPVINVDDLCSPVKRCSDPAQGMSSMPSDDSSARVRQVEADEILARQLQEQFYDEVPGAGDAEIDASIAWTLQQEESAHRVTSTSIGNHGLSRPRDSSIAHLYRNYSLESFHSSIRSTGHSGSTSGGRRVPTSMRMAQLRRSFRGRSPAVPSGGRRFQFPSSMDLDMRLHLLEALEAGFDGNNVRATHGRFLQVERDFNENDYEMLLALDNDNDRLGGASLDQINRLPLSIVQTDCFEEACAVCLETPSAGDSIRLLPCLHKFHKECIDAWLNRRALCPICKSSIT